MPNINGRLYLSVKETVERYSWLKLRALYNYIERFEEAKLDNNPKSKKLALVKQLIKHPPFIKIGNQYFVDIENFEKAPFVMGKTRNVEGAQRQPFTN